MKNILAILLSLALLSSCNHNKQPEIPVVGDMDSLAIANDTLTQKNIEANYEYAKTLTVNDKLVYDVMAYGGPASKGMYAIIRRGADNKQDTIVKGIREGIIKDVWLTKLDSKNQNEVIIITRTPDSTAVGNLFAYAVRGNEMIQLKYSGFLGDMMSANYHGQDSFYVQGNQIIRTFPLYADGDAVCCPSGGGIKIPYSIKGDELKEGKMQLETSSK